MPEDPNLWYWKAILAERFDDKEQSREYLEQTLLVSPFHQRGRLALARLDESQDRLLSAFQSYSALWQRDGLVEAQVAAAKMLRRLGQYERAAEVLADVDSPDANG